MSTTLIAFLGDLGDSDIERQVGEARRAATIDTLEAALACGHVDQAILVTDAPHRGAPPEIEVDRESGPFHFGRRLAEVIRRRRTERVIYFGGGSVPLLTATALSEIAASLKPGQAVANNVYSSDLVAFMITEGLLATLEGVGRDNALARALLDAGVAVAELPRRPETLFDIDSPSDLAVLRLTGGGGPRLRDYVRTRDLDTGTYVELLPVFLDPEKQLVLAGRVGSHLWRHLETETACRVRLFAEERGMEAESRAEKGVARSLVGYYLDSVGLQRFFETLAELGDAAVLDSRVLAAHAGAQPVREDRFLSDAGEWERISDPFLRHLTEAAEKAPLPVLLGGHSLMSGSLMLLNDHAWRLRDEGKI